MKFLGNSSTPQAVAVLRDVVMNAQPHALTRPVRNPVAPVAHLQDGPPQTGRESRLANHAPKSYDDGLAEGLRLGRAQGLAQAAAAREDAVRAAVEVALRAAHEQGLQDGQQEGLELSARAAEQQALRQREAAELAQEQGLRAIQERCARLDSLLEACATESARLLENSQDELVAIAHEAICKVLGSEACKPDVIAGMVKQLVAQHGLRETLSVHLHPADLEAMRLDDRTPSHGEWKYVPDPSIKLGGVILRSGNGSLDARIETQMQALGEALLSVRHDRRTQSVPSASGDC